MFRGTQSSPLFPYTTLFRSVFNRPINILCRVSLFLSMALCLLLRLFVFRLLRLKRFSTLTLKVLNLFSRSRRKRSEERFSRNAETDLVCRLLLEKKKINGTEPREGRKSMCCSVPRTRN